jgi:DNA ligase (NAD+)
MSVHDFFQSKVGQQIIADLRSVGVELTERQKEIKTSPLSGKTIVVTGSFEKLSRDELTDRLRSLGAKVTSAVTGKTDLLLAGKEPGSKLEKARELDVEVWSEDHLVRILENQG